MCPTFDGRFEASRIRSCSKALPQGPDYHDTRLYTQLIVPLLSDVAVSGEVYVLCQESLKCSPRMFGQ